MKNLQRSQIAAFLAFCLMIVLFGGLEYLEHQRFKESLRSRTLNRLSQIRANLESEINANFFLTRGLIAYISTHPDMDDQTFQGLSSEILKNKNYIRNISIAPNNTVRFVYPLQGNEKAIGLHYKDNPEQWPAVERVIASQNTVVAGPIHLVQGGVAFVSRTPIFLATSKDVKKNNTYWGLASIVIEMEPLFRAAGYYTAARDTVVAIRGKDGLGENGDMIEGDPSLFHDNPILLPVNLPNGSWQLGAIPAGGWDIASPRIVLLRIFGLVAASLIGFISFLWLHRQEKNRSSLESAWQQAKKAQEDLQANEEFLNTVIDNIPAMVFVKEAQHLSFVRMNKTGAEFLGYDVSEFLGKNDFDLFPEAEARFFTGKDREVLTSGKLLDILTEPIQTKCSGTKILHTRKIPVFDAQMNPLYLIGISDDITDKIKSQADKENLERQLQRSQKLETIGKMAGGVAHDLNNILSGIINYPELLLLQLPQDSPLRKPLEDIQNSGKRAANVVADLLTIARGVAAVRENTSLSNIIDEYLHSPEHKALLDLSSDISITVRLDPELWQVFCTPLHIRKCLMNLIVNAADAFEPGSTGKIEITGRNVDLQRSIPGFPDIESGRYVMLSVKDNGKGIDESDLMHIFEPFYTKKTLGRSGTGLGLTVVWNTIKDHLGAVEAESFPGKGTTFSLYLPAAKGDSTVESARSHMEDLQGNDQTILIVDDDPQQRDIANKILQHLHYQGQAVASGEEAIEYLKSHVVDLVILDMIMEPGMSGLKTYEAIITQTSSQKAIIASGFAEDEDVKKIQLLGAGQYVKKPYTIDQLGSAVKKALL